MARIGIPYIGVTAGNHIDGNETGKDFDKIIITERAFFTPAVNDPEAGTIAFVDPDTLAVAGIATYENIEKIIVQPTDEGMSDAMASGLNAETSGQGARLVASGAWRIG